MRVRPAAVAAFLGLVGLTGCVAETVEKKTPRRGPVPEVGVIEAGGGEVRYSTEGWDLIVSARRRDALRRIKSACKGLAYKITDEFMHQDADVTFANDYTDTLSDNLQKGIEHYHVRPYQHLVFECEFSSAAAAAKAPAKAP